MEDAVTVPPIPDPLEQLANVLSDLGKACREHIDDGQRKAESDFSGVHRRLSIAGVAVETELLRLRAEQAALREALGHAMAILDECGQDYNHPRFTDRHGTGPRINNALARCMTALSGVPASAEKETPE